LEEDKSPADAGASCPMCSEWSGRMPSRFRARPGSKAGRELRRIGRGSSEGDSDGGGLHWGAMVHVGNGTHSGRENSNTPHPIGGVSGVCFAVQLNTRPWSLRGQPAPPHHGTSRHMSRVGGGAVLTSSSSAVLHGSSKKRAFPFTSHGRPRHTLGAPRRFLACI